MTAKSKAAPGKHLECAAYSLSLLQAMADGKTDTGETVAEYAQRHLEAMHDLGYIEPARSLTPVPALPVDMQAACTERMRQIEPNGYPEKAVSA